MVSGDILIVGIEECLIVANVEPPTVDLTIFLKLVNVDVIRVQFVKVRGVGPTHPIAIAFIYLEVSVLVKAKISPTKHLTVDILMKISTTTRTDVYNP
jgi:hypothetical protein